MNRATIQFNIEQMDESERHQFLAGAQRVIVKLKGDLDKKRALAQRMLEAGVEDEQVLGQDRQV